MRVQALAQGLGYLMKQKSVMMAMELYSRVTLQHRLHSRVVTENREARLSAAEHLHSKSQHQCDKSHSIDIEGFKMCPACRLMVYCSKICQKAQWKDNCRKMCKMAICQKSTCMTFVSGSVLHYRRVPSSSYRTHITTIRSATMPQGESRYRTKHCLLPSSTPL